MRLNVHYTLCVNIRIGFIIHKKTVRVCRFVSLCVCARSFRCRHQRRADQQRRSGASR